MKARKITEAFNNGEQYVCPAGIHAYKHHGNVFIETFDRRNRCQSMSLTRKQATALRDQITEALETGSVQLGEKGLMSASVVWARGASLYRSST